MIGIRTLRALLVLALALTAIPAFAQTDGPVQLAVVVNDASGGRIPGASIILSRGTDERAVITNEQGLAELRNLEPGEWSLTVRQAGFASRQRPVVVQAGPQSITISLDVAAVQDSITVQTFAGFSDSVRLDSAATGGTYLDLPIRDLPGTLVVVTQDRMQERGANSGAEAVEAAGGIEANIGVGSLPGYRTRGFSGNSISIMRDGIRQNTQSQSSRPIDTFVLDRIEVLKGPASLLYGEGAVGAAVNYVSKEPARNLGADALLSYGSFGTSRAGLGINIPINDQLFVRSDASYSDTGGYVTPSGQRLRALVTSLRWRPNDRFTLKPSATITDDSVTSYYSTPFINGVIDPRTRFINYNMRDNLSKGRNNFGRLDAELVLGDGWRIRNGFFAATQRLDWRNMEGYSYNATTQKVRVSSYFLIHRNDDLEGNQTDVRKTFDVFGHTINFIGGFTVQRNYQLRGVTPPGTSIAFEVDPFNPEPIFDPGLSWVHGRTVVVNTKTTFAEAQTSVTERLKVVTGVRWEDIRVEHDNKLTNILDISRFRPVTGRVGAVYSVLPNVNLYSSYSRAQEPTTQLVSYDASQQGFHMTPSWQFESGAKATAFQGRLDGTFAYFYIQKRDIPMRTEIDGQIIQQQVGKQRSQGVELNFAARPTLSLTLSGDLAITLGEFLEFNENQGTGFISRAGNVPSGIPDIMWSLTPSQRVGPLTFALSARTVGGRWADNANTRRRSQYTTLDAWISIRMPTENNTRLTLRGRNLTDELYIPGGGSNTSGRIAAPRSLEASISASF